MDGGSGSDSSLVDEDSSELDCVAELDSEDDDDSHHGIDEDVSLDELVDSQSHGEVALAEERYGSENADDVDEDDG